MRHRGFTLVEVVVTIGIIILMAGLVISVSVVVVQGSETRETEQIIKLLEQAVLEWEASTGRKITLGTNGDVSAVAVYDMQQGTDPVFRITELLNTIARTESVRSIIAQINPELVYRYGGEYPPWIVREGLQSQMDTMWAAGITLPGGRESLGLAVLDAWGEPILVVHPGRVADRVNHNDDLSAADEDGTIRTQVLGGENVCGVARNRQILFISSGPDGDFGDLSQPVDSNAYKAARDNVVSYDPLRP